MSLRILQPQADGGIFINGLPLGVIELKNPDVEKQQKIAFNS
jgi:type I site-specific restriction-modification system R (restriction) subunit